MQWLVIQLIFIALALTGIVRAEDADSSSDVSGVSVTTDFDQQHKQYDQLLKKYVSATADGFSTVVDYKSVKKNVSQLDGYLSALQSVSTQTYAGWSREEKLAFLINAYNAWTLKLIVNHYPGIISIKDIGSFFQSPWSKSFIPLLGKQRSLDEIEHEMIRGDKLFSDERIHFAVNCASIGCPALRNEAYTADLLEQQLDSQTRQFLSDKSRNRASDDTIYLSKIFSWYEEDFSKGWNGISSLAVFLERYSSALGLNEKQLVTLKNNQFDIEYLDYDWALNELK